MRSVLLAVLAAEIGSSDCEELRDGALAQPVNAITSLAFVVIGAAVIVSVGRRRQRRIDTVDGVIFGLCLAAIGIGSVLFHGPQPSGSRILHDLPITLTILFMVVQNLALLVPGLPPARRIFAAGAVGASVVAIISLDAAAVVTGLLVVAVAVSETLIVVRRLRPADPRRRIATAAIIGVTAVGAATWILGRTDSPTCDPDSVLQLHGVWHVLAAIVFGLWWWSAYELGAAEDDRSSRDRRPVPS